MKALVEFIGRPAAALCMLATTLAVMVGLTGCAAPPANESGANGYPSKVHEYCAETSPERRALLRLGINLLLQAEHPGARLPGDLCRVVASIGDSYEFGDLAIAYCTTTNPINRRIIAEILGTKFVQNEPLSAIYCSELNGTPPTGG